MDDRDIRNCISDVARQLGIKIDSLQRNPLTNVWHIDIIERNEQIRFKPTSGATVEECARADGFGAKGSLSGLPYRLKRHAIICFIGGVRNSVWPRGILRGVSEILCGR